MYVTSQIIVFIGLIFDLIGRCLKRKNQVLIFNVIASLFYVSSYLFLTSWLAAIANALNLIRNLWYIHLTNLGSRYNKFIIAIISIMSIFILSLFIFWNNNLDLILLASMLISTIGFSFKNMLYLRIFIIINSSLFLTYNFTIQGYVNMFCDLIGIIITITAIIIYHLIPYIKNKKLNKISNNVDIEVKI